jgi:quercetin dioxygenase-like cupin family protein
MAGKAVVRKPGEGEALWMLDSLYEVKASGEETGGELTVMQMTVAPGMGPPPHTHPGGESVYVIEGQVRYHIDGETFEAGPGSFFYIPAGTVENFEPAGDEPIRVLVFYTPGGIDKFFMEIGEPAEKRELPPRSAEPPDLERIVSVGAKHGLDIKMPVSPQP